LRWIKAVLPESVQILKIIRFSRAQAEPTVRLYSGPGNLRNLSAMTARLGLDTAPAAWPAGVSLLAQVIDACRRCNTGELCSDWLARTPAPVAVAPDFCPNAGAFKQAKG
jgi:hypothetical protein